MHRVQTLPLSSCSQQINWFSISLCIWILNNAVMVWDGNLTNRCLRKRDLSYLTSLRHLFISRVFTSLIFLSETKDYFPAYVPKCFDLPSSTRNKALSLVIRYLYHYSKLKRVIASTGFFLSRYINNQHSTSITCF